MNFNQAWCQRQWVSFETVATKIRIQWHCNTMSTSSCSLNFHLILDQLGICRSSLSMQTASPRSGSSVLVIAVATLHSTTQQSNVKWNIYIHWRLGKLIQKNEEKKKKIKTYWNTELPFDTSNVTEDNQQCNRKDLFSVARKQHLSGWMIHSSLLGKLLSRKRKISENPFTENYFKFLVYSESIQVKQLGEQ